MIKTKPRIPPLPEAAWTEETRELLSARGPGGRVLNIFATFAQHPKLLKRWTVFAGHVFGKSTLPPRDRELLILRTGYLCKSHYEWGQHAIIARMIGITDDELRRVTLGPGALGWDQFEASLLQAADELHDEQTIADPTWDVLAKKYSPQQMMDLVFTVGHYTLVSMALNAFGVQRDEGVAGFPASMSVPPGAGA
jgi:alkylhydroperoxidase family enzyme